MAKKSDYSLFINFFSNSLKIGIFIIFRPSSFAFQYSLAHYSLFIIKKGHYSLITIPHLDPLISILSNGHIDNSHTEKYNDDGIAHYILYGVTARNFQMIMNFIP